MSNLWRPSNQSPSGFVYFDTPKTPVKNEFISFGGSSEPQSPASNFCPGSYSSPRLKPQRGSPGGYNNNYQQRHSGGRHSRNSHSFRNSFQSNKSFGSPNSSYDSNNRSSFYIEHSGSYSPRKQFVNDRFDKEKYLQQSFIEDPWAELERLQNKEDNNSSTG